MINLRLTLGVALLLGIATAQGGLRAQDAGRAPSLESELALGKLLFADVVSVHFMGPGHPANPDGSLGGLGADDQGGSIKIYEHYICRESAKVDGVCLREFHPYVQLGKFEQRRDRRTQSQTSRWRSRDCTCTAPPAPGRWVLAELGKEGWELVTVTQPVNGAPTFYLKRPLRVDAPAESKRGEERNSGQLESQELPETPKPEINIR